MKYTIARQSSFLNDTFKVTNDSQTVCTVKTKPSKQCQGQFDLVLTNLMDDRYGECSCLVEPDAKQSHQYLIFSINNQTCEKVLFGRLSYKIQISDNIYKILIGDKLYQVRSSDLKDRRLSIIDINSSENNYSETLFELADSICKSNKIYHVNIHNKEWPLAYFAFTILLYLHETRRFD